MNTKEKTPLPIFLKADKIPGDVSTYEICSAAEEVSGPVTIDGAICISGLWRISPLYEASRIKILANGIPVRGCTVGVESVNPFTLRGDESSGTKLYIGNLPFSYSSEAVKKHLQAAGVTLRSDIVWEKARGPDGTLSDWKTGRRMVWINVPTKPLNKFLRMGNGFSAILYYKEMKESRKCNKCLQFGHIAKYCDQEEVCYTCKKTGHRKGDPKCDLGSPDIMSNSQVTSICSVEEDISKSMCSADSHKNEKKCSDKELDVNVDEHTVDSHIDNSDSSHSDWETSEEFEEGQHEKSKPVISSDRRHRKNSETTYSDIDNQKNVKGGNGVGKKSNKKKKSKKSSKNHNRNNNDSPNSTSLKQCHITEYTPGGKRGGSMVFSPDASSSTGQGPSTKKTNIKE